MGFEVGCRLGMRLGNDEEVLDGLEVGSREGPLVGIKVGSDDG